MIAYLMMNNKGERTMATIYKSENEEISRLLAPWLRACVDHGLLKVWLSEKAPEYIKELYRNCYS